MTARALKGRLTIGFSSDDTVRIYIEDEISGITFAEATVGHAEFAKALGARAYQPCDIQVRGLANVGLKRVTERREIECPDMGYQRETYEHWLKENAQEEGWILSTYLGSRSSIQRTYGKDTVVLNYSVTKFVKPENT